MTLEALERRLGHEFLDPTLLRRALCHRSWVSEHEGETSNERLEFLGDAVLGWVIADLVYHRFGEHAEGALTDLRKSVVNANALAAVASDLGLGKHVLLGKGEAAAGGSAKVSILSDVMEAVLGAIYLDAGVDAAFGVIERLFVPQLHRAVDRLDRLDQKSALQEFAASHQRSTPVYRLTSTGPDHDKIFTAQVVIDGDVVGVGTGPSKKAAEQVAAGVALNVLLDAAPSA